MKPEKLLDALNDIDSSLIAGAHAPRSQNTRPRFTLLIAAVLVTAALTATAFASETISGWFKQYFERRNENPLTSEQIQYIEENEQVIGETKTQNDITLNLKSVLADSNTLYITLGITSTSALPLDNVAAITSDGIDFYNQNMMKPTSTTIQLIDDKDGLDTTAYILFELHEGNWNDGGLWTLDIDKIITLFYDEEYKQNLIDTKYAGQENIVFTDEEAALIYQQVTLAEGPWEFVIDMSKVDGEHLEIVTEPITITGIRYIQPGGMESHEELIISSVIIRPFGASIYTILSESLATVDIHALDKELCAVVMKDGSYVELRFDWSIAGEAHLTAASPIILTEVDHILLPDGTKIMAP